MHGSRPLKYRSPASHPRPLPVVMNVFKVVAALDAGALTAIGEPIKASCISHNPFHKPLAKQGQDNAR